MNPIKQKKTRVELLTGGSHILYVVILCDDGENGARLKVAKSINSPIVFILVYINNLATEKSRFLCTHFPEHLMQLTDKVESEVHIITYFRIGQQL